MFDKRDLDMVATLSEMHMRARDKAKFNRDVARGIMSDWVQQDRRFDAYDPQRLVDRVQQRSASGGVMDLNDPFLRKGGQARDGWKQPGTAGYR
jgi:hypothetical protein